MARLNVRVSMVTQVFSVNSKSMPVIPIHVNMERVKRSAMDSTTVLVHRVTPASIVISTSTNVKVHRVYTMEYVKSQRQAHSIAFVRVDIQVRSIHIDSDQRWKNELI